MADAAQDNAKLIHEMRVMLGYVLSSFVAPQRKKCEEAAQATDEILALLRKTESTAKATGDGA